MPYLVVWGEDGPLRLLVFDLLPSILRKLGIPHVFFFNDHYVVKPPHSPLEFAWHTDSFEQLKFHPLPLPAYISFWIPLQDTPPEMGGMQVLNSHDPIPPESSTVPSPLRKHIRHLNVKSGDALLFSSNLWHASGPNQTGSERVAYYVQYSAAPITVRGMPLRFGIPC